VASLLEYFLAHPDELLSHDQLIQTVWDGRVVSDDAVRHAVSTLRHTLAADGNQQWIETVHKKGYISRFPTAEATQGSVHASDVITAAAHPAARPHSPKALPRQVLPALLLLIIIASVFWWLQHRPGSGEQPVAGGPRTIAVLPLTVLGDSANLGDFASGLTEELRSMLARFSAFRVTARDSSLRFPGGQVDPHEVGQELGVEFLLEGSVRRNEELLRISAALVETRTGFRKWSQSYNANLQNLFEVQQDIATSVARALQVVLVQRNNDGVPGNAPASAEAHLEYLKGRQQMASWVTKDFDQAIRHFQQAIELDPAYASAYIQLANAIMLRDSSTESLPFQASVKAVVKKLIEKGLELDPGLGEAYAARSYLYEMSEVGAIEADLRQAIQLNPSYSPAYEELSLLLAATGRDAEAFMMIDQARALDPLWPRHHHIKAYLQADLGQWPQARALERETLRLEPRYVWALIGLGRIAMYQGNFAEGLHYMEQAFSLDPANKHLAQRLAIYYLSAGDLAAAQYMNRLAGSNADLYLAVFANDYQGMRDMLAGPGEVAYDPFMIHLHTDLLLRLALAEGDIAWARGVATSRYGFDGALQVPLDLWEYLSSQLNLVLLWYLGANTEQTLPLIAELRERMPPAGAPYSGYRVTLPTFGRAIAAAVLGETETALRTLEFGLDSGNPWWWWLRGHPAFDGLREEPRFQALIAAAEDHAAEQRVLLAEMRRAGVLPDRHGPPAVADKNR
jgi:TolB-like protein/Flp pilus assembly protein TadD